MTSTLKVDQIQLADGSTPTAADLGLNVTGSVLSISQVTLNQGQTISATSYAPVTGSSITITPKSSSSKMLIEGVAHVYFNHSTNVWGAAPLSIYRDNTVIFTDSGSVDQYGTSRLGGHLEMTKNSLSMIDTPNTTSPVTYQLGIRSRDGTYPSFKVNMYGRGHFRVIEIAG